MVVVVVVVVSGCGASPDPSADSSFGRYGLTVVCVSVGTTVVIPGVVSCTDVVAWDSVGTALVCWNKTNRLNKHDYKVARPNLSTSQGSMEMSF